VRIIAATARDLAERTRTGHFRSDLFHRLSVLCFEIPPLRARLGDIPLLAEQLVHDLAQRYGMARPQLPPETHACLQSHSWPGNVRELGNTMERALLLHHGSSITPASISVLPTAISTTSTPHAALTAPASGIRYSFPGSAAEEHAQIRAALTACRGNKTRAAALLGMSRGTLRNKLRALSADELRAIKHL
jgi:two-component system response regulator HupR/HoxA